MKSWFTCQFQIRLFHQLSRETDIQRYIWNFSKKLSCNLVLLISWMKISEQVSNLWWSTSSFFEKFHIYVWISVSLDNWWNKRIWNWRANHDFIFAKSTPWIWAYDHSFWALSLIKISSITDRLYAENHMSLDLFPLV